MQINPGYLKEIEAASTAHNKRLKQICSNMKGQFLTIEEYNKLKPQLSEEAAVYHSDCKQIKNKYKKTLYV